MQWRWGLVVFAFATAHSPAQTPPPLFTVVADASAPTPPRAFAVFPVGINFPALDANPESISIQLPLVGPVTAVRRKWQPRPGGGYDWIGKTASHDVTLSVDGKIIIGFIRGGADTFSLLSDLQEQDAFYTLHHVNPAAFPDDVVLENSIEKGATLAQPERACFGKEFEPINLLIVFSPEALEAAGGDVAVMETSMANAVVNANVTLENSQVPTWFNLVRIEQAPASLIEQRNINDPTNASTNPDVIALRRHWQADMVTYVTSAGLTPQNREFCGAAATQRRAGQLGYGYDFAPHAVNVVTWACGVQDNALSHEAGHNAGLDHNPGFTLSTPQENLFPYAYGHHVNGMFRDDMSGTSDGACPDPCPRQMFFSDPNQEYLGLPRGIAGLRDNAQVYRKMFRCLNTYWDVVFVDGLE